MSEPLRFLLGTIAAVLVLAAFIPYLRDIGRGKTKPHAVSWLIWTIVTTTAFYAQRAGNAGAGAWVTGAVALFSFIIFLAGCVRGEREITRFDWACLLLALSAVPLWFVSSTPIFSVVVATFVETLGYLPTFRKSYAKPAEETLATYVLNGLSFLIGLVALEQYSIVTALYPAVFVMMHAAFIAMTLWRRRVLGGIYAEGRSV